MTDLTVDRGSIEITERVTITLREPRELVMSTWNRNSEPIRVEEFRFRFHHRNGEWEFGWATVLYRRIRKDGTSYTNRQDMSMSMADMLTLVPDILEAAIPRTNITIEGKPE